MQTQTYSSYRGVIESELKQVITDLNLTPHSQRKDLTLAIIFNVLLLGLGQFYVGRTTKGIGLVAAGVVSFILMAFGIGVLTYIAFLVWAVIDVKKDVMLIDAAISYLQGEPDHIAVGARGYFEAQNNPSYTLDAFKHEVKKAGALLEAGLLTEDENADRLTKIAKELSAKELVDDRDDYLLAAAELHKNGMLTAAQVKQIKVALL